MRFKMFILALMSARSVCAQEGVKKTDHIDFSINGGQYSSLSGTYYFLGGGMRPNGYAASLIAIAMAIYQSIMNTAGANVRQ